MDLPWPLTSHVIFVGDMNDTNIQIDTNEACSRNLTDSPLFTRTKPSTSSSSIDCKRPFNVGDFGSCTDIAGIIFYAILIYFGWCSRLPWSIIFHLAMRETSCNLWLHYLDIFHILLQQSKIDVKKCQISQEIGGATLLGHWFSMTFLAFTLNNLKSIITTLNQL